MTQAGFIDASEAPPRATNEIKLHGKDAFEGMRKSGRVSAECLDMLIPYVVPGVSTGKLDDLAREFLLDHAQAGFTKTRDELLQHPVALAQMATGVIPVVGRDFGGCNHG